MFPTHHYFKMLTCRPITHLKRRHFDQNVFYTSLPTNVDLSTCHTSQIVNTDKNVSYTSLPQNEMSTCRPVTYPRRSTFRLERFLHLTASNVDVSYISEGWHFKQNVSYTSLPHNVDLSTCHMSQKVDTLTRMCSALHRLKTLLPQNVDLSHILEGWHFDQNVSCTSLPHNVDLSTCHTSQRSTLWPECFLHFTASNCWSVTHRRRSTLWTECFLHFTASNTLNRMFPTRHCFETLLPENINLSHISEGRHFDQNVSCPSLSQNVDLSHIPEGRHFDQNVSCTSQPQTVDLLNIPECRHFVQNVFCTSLPQNISLLICHTSKKVNILTKMFPTLLISICIERGHTNTSIVFIHPKRLLELCVLRRNSEVVPSIFVIKSS